MWGALQLRVALKYLLNKNIKSNNNFTFIKLFLRIYKILFLVNNKLKNTQNAHKFTVKGSAKPYQLADLVYKIQHK